MKYVVLVSHGTFAPGLHSVLKMLAGGEREDVISVGLEDGMSADEFAEKFSNAISKITEDDEIILLGDIVGGSPLTNAIDLSESAYSHPQSAHEASVISLQNASHYPTVLSGY